ncbi:glycoside hydrolase family 88 protein [Enterococcus asini]|uniref:glycoside hydrolase family 88 protein n=1 Tax=Enterococcus asini TaxID=57732 RepID=UPI000E5191A4|nr:glycoside hydrolase family 88 protein [Enterococcus asini]RGW11936.1 glycosyl hydrolase family 88 [Enterococcus asini]
MNEQQWLQDTLKKTVIKLRKEAISLGASIPYIPYDGHYTDVVEERGLDWWTNGFWSGILWQLYHLTKDDFFKEQAKKQEDRLVSGLSEFQDVHHDVGFLFLPSSVSRYRLTREEQAKRRGLLAATLLAGRFNPTGNFLVAWNDGHPGRVIIDSMMNLPLLYWATEETQDPRFAQIANRHKEIVSKYLVSSEGNVAQIATFNSITGEFLGLQNGQGYQVGSAWSRGNAWALYGFASAYSQTGQAEDLQQAKKIADFVIPHVIESAYVTPVDFLAPATPKIYDTSAGLCIACGLLELAQWLPGEEVRYQKIALKIVQATAELFADWSLEREGIIGGGTESYHRPLTYEVPLIYNDYFFLEALLRLQGVNFVIW